MTPELAVQLVRAALMTAVLLAGPLLAVALVVGLVAGVIQTATGVQEQSVTSVLKLTVVGATLLALMPWMLGVASGFLSRLLTWAATLPG